jgi:hypothetical protein
MASCHGGTKLDNHRTKTFWWCFCFVMCIRNFN